MLLSFLKFFHLLIAISKSVFGSCHPLVFILIDCHPLLIFHITEAINSAAQVWGIKCLRYEIRKPFLALSYMPLAFTEF